MRLCPVFPLTSLLYHHYAKTPFAFMGDGKSNMALLFEFNYLAYSVKIYEEGEAGERTYQYKVRSPKGRGLRGPQGAEHSLEPIRAVSRYIEDLARSKTGLTVKYRTECKYNLCQSP